MTFPVGIERKVRQLDNDVRSIYEMLTSIKGTQRRHGNRLDELSGQVDGVSSQVTDLSGRVDGLTDRFDGVSSQVTDLSGRFDGLTDRFDGLTDRVDGIDGKVDGVAGQLTEVLSLLRDKPAAR
ncbi:MAG TPA: hypothetical protein VLJ59_15060 [Mycobacteriales bacterium]|nr:hypothetical protein [Mycobacteriales bacterium]